MGKVPKYIDVVISDKMLQDIDWNDRKTRDATLDKFQGAVTKNAAMLDGYCTKLGQECESELKELQSIANKLTAGKFLGMNIRDQAKEHRDAIKPIYKEALENFKSLRDAFQGIAKIVYRIQQDQAAKEVKRLKLLAHQKLTEAENLGITISAMETSASALMKQIDILLNKYANKADEFETKANAIYGKFTKSHNRSISITLNVMKNIEQISTFLDQNNWEDAKDTAQLMQLAPGLIQDRVACEEATKVLEILSERCPPGNEKEAIKKLYFAALRTVSIRRDDLKRLDERHVKLKKRFDAVSDRHPKERLGRFPESPWK